jgi:hypothetical protein
MPKLVDTICFKTIQLYSNEYLKGKSEETTGNGISEDDHFRVSRQHLSGPMWPASH